MTSPVGNDPIILMLVLGALSLLPLACIVGTSFLKLAIVLLVVRNAIGVQQVPPQLALYAVALSLTAFIMAPVGHDMVDIARSSPHLTEGTLAQRLDSLQSIAKPWINYLRKNADPEALETYGDIARRHWPQSMQAGISEANVLIALPSFTVSELKRAFEIGFLLYVPFIVIDLVVSNILLALGMQMVAPMTFSTPLKLLLFVAVDGWRLLLIALTGLG